MIRYFLTNYSFKLRLRIAFAVMIALSVSACGFISYYISARVVQDNALKLSQDALNKSSQAFDEKLRHVAVSLMTLFISSAFDEAMKDVVAGDPSTYFKHYSALQTPFMQMKLNEPLMQSMLVSTPIGDFYPTDALRQTLNPFKGSEMYERIQKERRAIWVEGHPDPFFSGNEPVVSLVLNAISLLTVPDSYIVVNLKEEGLRHFLTDNIREWREGVTIVKEDGTPIFENASYRYAGMLQEPEFVAKLKSADYGAFNYEYKDEEFLVNYVQSTLDERWIYLSVKPKAEVLSQATSIKWATIAVTLACIVVAFFVSNGMTALVAKPLTQLQKLMRRAGENDLAVRFHSGGNNEVTQVGMQFNRMLEQITGLMEDNRHVQKEKHRAEIKALQAQIDPHFLYNTLNTIYWKTKLKKSEEVGQMVMALSKLFQLGLNNGQEMTTIKKELLHVEQYLSIQQKCYDNLFEYRVEAPQDDEFQQHPILKVLLQPLVENSILHGFKDKQSGGFIRIRLDKQEDLLIITVEDNGHGTDAQEAERRFRTLTEATDSYALRNIFQRLRLYYEDQADLRLSSVPGKGTTVTLTIPWSGGNGHESL